MSDATNRHVAIVTMQHPSMENGQPFRTQLVPSFSGTEAEALRWLDDQKARHAAADTSVVILEWHGLHSWYESPIPPQWGPPPMAGLPGPDEDPNEVTDIPRAWERWR